MHIFTILLIALHSIQISQYNNKKAIAYNTFYVSFQTHVFTLSTYSSPYFDDLIPTLFRIRLDWKSISITRRHCEIL